MSELFDKEMNAQKESLKKASGVHTSSRKPTKKCAMKMKETKKKRCTHKNVIDGRKPFIRRTQRTGENDLNERRVNDSGHNEGTIILFSKRMNGWFFECGRMNGRHLTRIGWYSGLVVPISSIVGLLILYN